MRFRLHPGRQSSHLRVFFAGWGMDDTPFLPFLGEVETAIVWDYADLSTPLPFLNDDRPRSLVAWSLGVWAATQVLRDADFVRTTAVNGTPMPIDDTRGIPTAVFDETLRTFSEAGVQRFRRRMCGGAAALAEWMRHAPRRTIEDLGAELAAFSTEIRRRPPRPFRWDRAFAASGDRIFPPAAQRAAFPSAETVPEAHWAPELFARLLREEA